jgi:predicted alpha/beta hydrolase
MQLFVERGADQLSIQLYDHPGAESLVLILPAMGVPARYYRRFAETLRASGSVVAVADPRGTGDSSPRATRGSHADYGDLSDDVGAVLAALGEYRTGRRTILLGHSLGGQVAVMYLARSGGADVDGLVLTAAGMPHWRAYGSRGAQAHLLRAFVVSTVSICGYWTGWGFGGRQAGGIMRDWAHTSRTGEFPDHLLVTDTLANITTPTLVLTVDGDKHTPPAVVNNLVDLLTAAPIQREHITAAAAGAPLDHLRWAKVPVPISAAVVDWMKSF